HLFCIHIGKKRIGTSADNSNPTPNEERQLTIQHEDVDAEVQEVLGEVVEMVLTTGDVDVVEEETHFSSASAQILINESGSTEGMGAVDDVLGPALSASGADDSRIDSRTESQMRSVISLVSDSFSLVASLKHARQANLSGKAGVPHTQQAFAAG
ncbi:hypothetical protein AB205_0021330, partial [Aquarana catesbeiana]